ncbi:hypothetical protein [Streptomyces sp. NBC_00448]|uniref:hypothetical protein n=1 Tax=Streptomyces sp. NBC_00448 TaxID=2903652 RepID=UPI002E1FA1D4
MKRRIASWENGPSVAEGFYGALLAAALELGSEEMGLPRHGSQDAALLDVRYPLSPDATISAVSHLWRADLHGYEPLLASPPSQPAWSDASLRWLVAPEPAPLSGDHASSARRIGLTDVAVIKSTGDAFARLDDQFGGEHARHAVIQYLSCDVAPLLRGRYNDATGRALFSTVAELTLLAGWMSYDACHHGLAQRYFLQALRFAQDSGKRRLAGSVLSATSHQATFLGQFTQAATLARATRMGISGVATPTLMAQFHAMEARALARTGHRKACEQALVESTRHLERRHEGDEPEWITYFDEAGLAAEAAQRHVPRQGTIPAGAGSTGCPAPGVDRAGDHPRGRGEHSF